MKIANHFTIAELTGTNNKELFAQNILYALDHFNELVRLAQFCEKVREVLNVPMRITSGVRYEALNKFVGGASNSDHIKLLAIDFVPVNLTLKKAFDKIRNSNLDYKQLILEKGTWIHISIGEKRDNLVYDGKKYKRVF